MEHEKKKLYAVYMRPSEVEKVRVMTGADSNGTALACAARLALTRWPGGAAETASERV